MSELEILVRTYVSALLMLLCHVLPALVMVDDDNDEDRALNVR
jgi:hypothetical protein